MTEHKWIIVDDREQIAERLKLSLEQWWKHLFGEELNVAVSTDPDEGIQQVMDNDFDVAIIDILFPSPLTDGPSTDSPPQTARGLDVIRVARDEDVSLIVGISRGDTINHPRIEEQALENGVNLFYYKSEIEKPGFAERFCKDIDVKLKPRKHGSGQRLLNYDKEDPRVAWPVEQIGIDTVCDLYEQSTRGQFQLRTGELFHVSRGYSGAIVLGIKGLTVDDVPIEHILKIDRNGKRIREELIRNPQGKRYRTDLALSYLVDRTYEPQPVQGWYAIAAPFYHGGETLQSWLSKEPSADSVNTILRAVFEDRGLDSGYSDLGQTTTETHQAETPLALMMPGDYSRAGILSGIDELSDAIMQIPPKRVRQIWDADVLRRFVLTGQINTTPPEYADSSPLVCTCHGDLHCRNILVSGREPPSPVLIDWAGHGPGHWALDVARLLADLLLCSVDTGGEAYKWSKISEWLSLARWIYGKGEREVSEVDSAACSAISWLLSNHENLFKKLEDHSERRWEFILSLAVEFTRSGMRSDLSDAKRAMGLLAGCVGIRLAEEELKYARREYPNRFRLSV